MTPASRSLLGITALLSGAAALVYQVLWVRTLGEMLGSTAYAVNTVLAVFFTGLGLGGWIFGRRADRRAGAIGLVVALELVIALAGALFPLLAGLLEGAYDAMAPAEWSLTRAVLVKAPMAAALLAVPTLAMGGTLPALVRHVVTRSEELGGRLGWIYGTNTVGAALGVALAVLLLIPSVGMQGAAWIAAGMNVLAAACAFLGRRRAEAAEAPAAATLPRASAAGGSAMSIPRFATFVSGFLAVGLEVLWTRALAARFLSTVYSYATILFAFLACLGLGAWLAGWMDRRGFATRRTAVWVLLAAGLTALASVPLLARMAPVDAASGESLLHLRAIELSKAVLVMCLPVILFGLNFPLLCRLAHRESAAVGRELGGMLVANTIGSVLAPLLVGFVVLPALGLRTSLIATGLAAIVFALLVLSPWSRPDREERGRHVGIGSVAALLLVVVALRGDVRLWREDPTDRLLAYQEGAAASVAVVQKADGTRTLKIDHSYRLGDSRTVFATRRQGLIPRLLHGDARRMLFIGMGTGGSAGAAASNGAEAVDVLEIVPGLGRYLPYFDEANEALAARLAAGTGTRLLEVDGRHFVRTSERSYDAVVGDLFIPWRAGEGAMYTREHFEAVRARLAAGGLFAQWLPLYQLDTEDLRTITATFCGVFPHAEAFWLYFNVTQPAIGLFGSNEPLRVDLASLERDMAAAAPDSILGRAGLTEAAPLLGSWIAGRETLATWSAGAPLETRDAPRIEFSAPLRRIGRGWSPSAANVTTLLELARPIAEAPFANEWHDTARAEVERYRRAITEFHRGATRQVYAGDLASALAAFDAALEETPTWGWIAFNIESVLVQAASAGDTVLARTAAEALRRRPTFAHLGHYHLASLAARTGDLEGARTELDHALSLEPGHEASLRLRAELFR